MIKQSTVVLFIMRVVIPFLFLFFTMWMAANSVYICRSPGAYAYHTNYCQGLRNCNHRVDTVSVDAAYKLGFKKYCGYCSKMNRK